MTITFDKKLAELDAYLQMLIDQNETIDKKIESSKSESEIDGLKSIKTNLQNLLASIKHAIVLLQIAKVSIRADSSSADDSATSGSSIASKSSRSPNKQQQQYSPQPPARRHKPTSGQQQQQQQNQLSSSPKQLIKATPLSSSSSSSSSSSPSSQKVQLATNHHDDDNNEATTCCQSSVCSPSQSVSLHSNDLNECIGGWSQKCNSGEPTDLDEDDTFYDAAAEQSPSLSLSQPNEKENNNLNSINISNNNNNNNNNNIVNDSELIVANDNNISFDSIRNKETKQEKIIDHTMTNSKGGNTSGRNSSGSNIDWDSMYEEEEEDLGSLESEGSVIRHLLSQIRIGMDLTKVVLPTFILERRSLLEMYADFFAHPDLFSSIPDFETPEDRMIQIVKWYLSAFHAGRKSSTAKKPYNPILGEIFLCHWNLNPNTNTNDDNNLVDSSEPSAISDIETFSERLPKDSLLFVAEQVSHHPPVSAFYAENTDKQISCCAHIYTKSKYLGLSVGVHNVGQGVINVLKHNETYVCTFPSAYGRSILTVPWVELGGSVNINCEQTGYSANIEFATKPFYGGKKHRVTGEILRPNKEMFLTIDGEWNGCMHYKSPPNSKENRVFVDTTSLPVIKKNVRSINCQESFESRNVWKEVTRALKLRDVNSATAAKSYIEQRQRDLLKGRTEKGAKWETRYFEQVGDDSWSYAKPLADRLKLMN